VRALAPLFLIACGRIGFTPMSADAPPALTWSGSLLASQARAVSTTAGFQITPSHQGDAILLHVACDGAATATTVTASAPGWTFVQLGTLVGLATKWGAAFGATAPDTALTTVTVTWNITCNGIDALADEFANVDPAAPFDAFDIASGQGSCAAALTTASAGDAIWAACSSGGTLVGADPGYIKAGDDTNDDWSEYKLTTDPAGTVETATFAAQPPGTFVMTTVALKPR
jgi:hypothetical protein